MPRWFKSNGVLWNFRTIKLQMTGKNQRFELSFIFQKFECFVRDQDGTYQASSYGELGVSISRWNIIKSTIRKIKRSVFTCEKQNQRHYHRDCFPTEKLFIEISIDQMKPVVMGEKSGCVWKPRETNNRRVSWEMLDYTDSDATNRINRFSPQDTLTSVTV